MEVYGSLPSTEGGLALCAAILLVSGVQFDVSVSTSFMFEQATAEVTTERHLVTVRLQKQNKIFSSSFSSLHNRQLFTP